jgi:alpha-beta hydrolase superfamily lysophospholipase
MNSKIGEQLNLPIYEWVDNKKPRQGMIVTFPALTLYAKSWDSIARYLAGKGYQVFALEMRGFGRWRTEGSSKFGANHNIDFAQSQQDLLDLVSTLQLMHPHQKLFCLGESLGSNMILILLSKHADLADGAILVSPGYKNRVHPNISWATDFATQIVQPGKPLSVMPYSGQYVTTNKALAQAWSSDPMIYRKMTPKDLIDVNIINAQGISAAKDLPQNFPVLIIAGLDDGIFKSAELPKAIKNFGTHNVSLNLLRGKGHLLLENQDVDPQIALLIDEWLNHQSTQAKSSLTKIQR